MDANYGNFSKSFVQFLLAAICTAAVLQVNGKHVVCYWGSWSHYRTGEGRFSVDDIDPNLCTHIIYSFATIDGNSFLMKSSDPRLDHGPGDSPAGVEDMYRKVVALKQDTEADLLVMLGIGGAKFGSKIFSEMVSNKINRKLFVESAGKIITNFGFDGLDIDWEYPTFGDGSHPDDKKNFVELLKELRVEFGKTPSIRVLSTAINAGKAKIDQAYDLLGIRDQVDFISLMAYDFKMYRSDTPLIGHHSPLYPDLFQDDAANIDLTVQKAVQYVLSKGVPSEILVLGMAAYGRTYTLNSRDEHYFYNQAKGPGIPYRYSDEPGIVMYLEICLNLAGAPGWEYEVADYYEVPYAFNETQWIGYDDGISAREKAQFVLDNNLAGMMIWSLDMDDCKRYCGGWEDGCQIAGAIRSKMNPSSQKIKQNKDMP